MLFERMVHGGRYILQVEKQEQLPGLSWAENISNLGSYIYIIVRIHYLYVSNFYSYSISVIFHNTVILDQKVYCFGNF